MMKSPLDMHIPTWSDPTWRDCVRVARRVIRLAFWTVQIDMTLLSNRLERAFLMSIVSAGLANVVGNVTGLAIWIFRAFVNDPGVGKFVQTVACKISRSCLKFANLLLKCIVLVHERSHVLLKLKCSLPRDLSISEPDQYLRYHGSVIARLYGFLAQVECRLKRRNYGRDYR